MHCSVSMSRHSSSASTRGVNTLVPPCRNVASVEKNVAMWNSGPQFRYTYVESISASRPIINACPINALCDSIAALGRPENAAVYISSTGSPASTGRSGSSHEPDARNASYSPLSCWIQRASPAAGDAARAACTVSPISAAWCTTTAAARSSSTNVSSSADCRQLAAAEVGAELGRREQALEEAERVLAEPQDAVARADAGFARGRSRAG